MTHQPTLMMWGKLNMLSRDIHFVKPSVATVVISCRRRNAEKHIPYIGCRRHKRNDGLFLRLQLRIFGEIKTTTNT